ncbi:MAG: PP2C family protein-serine/threonine phosphatase [Leptospiraceae bacterium]|nr:PP2C family protein-serine/threonine phosphatase [Leptospiraceae bacterium]MCP5496198.1 PP2C family protein-serine/threonine phosphatase [Leptospiraceae bacterium]
MKIYSNSNLLASFRPQEIRGEQIINVFRFLLCCIFFIFLLFVVHNNQWRFSKGNLIVISGISIGILHCIVMFFILKKRKYHPFIKYINTFLESVIVTIAIYSSSHDLYSSRASMFIVNTPLIYLLFSGLSVLRLSFRACFLSGFFNAVGYLFLIFLSRNQSGIFNFLFYSNDPTNSMVIRFALDNELIKTFYIFFSGVIAGYGTIRNKKLVIAYLEKQQALDELNQNLEKKVKLRTKEIQKRQEIMESELDLARDIQFKLLPQKLPEHPSVDIYSKYLPAYKVGGDFYDIFLIGSKHIGIFVCDVFGHGVSAAFVATILKMLLERKKYILTNPVELFLYLDEQLRRVVTKNFVTAFYGIIDCEKGKMTYINAGLLPPFVLNPKKETSGFLEYKGGTLGTPLHFSMETREIDLFPYDRIVIYTDGLLESINPNTLELFGEDRFKKYIISHKKSPAESLVQGLLKEVKNHACKEQLDDDITVLVVDYHPP